MSRQAILSSLVLSMLAASSYSANNLSVDKLTSDDLQGSISGKKIVSFMDEFYTTPAARIADMMERMQEVEMDGICINFFPDDQGNRSGMMHRWFGIKARKYETFKEEVDIYRSINWGRYTDNFVYSCTSSHFVGHAPYDWFSDEDTAIWLGNC